MKELFIIRHAKSSWSNFQERDFDRPLNERGRVAAPEMGERLVKGGITPNAIVSSPAKRAITTARLIAGEFERQIQIIEEPKLYHASPLLLLDIVNGLPDKFEKVFLVGHNPGLTDFSEYLSDAQLGSLPTAAVVGIRFEIDSWSLVSGSTGDFFLFDYPKKVV